MPFHSSCSLWVLVTGDSSRKNFFWSPTYKKLDLVFVELFLYPWSHQGTPMSHLYHSVMTTQLVFTSLSRNISFMLRLTKFMSQFLQMCVGHQRYYRYYITTCETPKDLWKSAYRLLNSSPIERAHKRLRVEMGKGWWSGFLPSIVGALRRFPVLAKGKDSSHIKSNKRFLRQPWGS